MRVLVAGAGIGGSTLALALEKLGIDYLLLEQASAFEDVGAGIQLSPNGVRILEWLGLAEDLAAFCCTPDFHKFGEWETGEVLLRTALMPKVLEHFGAAYYHAYRPDLIEALTRRLNPEKLVMNCRVACVGQDEAGVTVDTSDGRDLTGDVLIGADGIHSIVREQVFKPGPPKPSGYVTWRGIVDASDIAHLDIPVSAYVVMGPRLSFVFYYVSGGSRFNWLALGQTGDTKRESWSQTASKDEILACFDGWYDLPRQVIEATETPFVTALYDRDPLPSWTEGRVVLMGDAAHAMLPYHAQGAVQSIEDAWVLARCLEEGAGDPAAALRRYEDLRYDRANRMVQQSRNAEAWYHYDDPAEVAARNARFRKTNDAYGDNFTTQQRWLYAYDAEKAVQGTDDEWRALQW